MPEDKKTFIGLASADALTHALDRCAFLLAAISGGDHKALANAEDAARQALEILRDAGYEPEWAEMIEDEEDADPHCNVCGKDTRRNFVECTKCGFVLCDACDVREGGDGEEPHCPAHRSVAEEGP